MEAESNTAQHDEAVTDPNLFYEAQMLLGLPLAPQEHPTHSFWLTSEPPFDVKPFESTLISTEAYDTVIIGGGLTGVSLAYWLTENGIEGNRILLIEGRELSGGATGRNGGHCWPSTRVWSEKLLRQYGREHLERGEEWKYQSASMFMTWLEENKIDCDFRRTGCCEMARWKDEVSEFEEYMSDKKHRMPKLGSELELWDAEKSNQVCSGNEWKACLFQTLAGQFWPRKAVLGIAQIAMTRGVHIRTQTTVRGISRPSSSDAPFTLDTTAGSVHCKRIIHATNGYSAGLLPNLKGVILPVRGQVLATSPIEGFHVPHNLGFNDGYEYLIHRAEDKRIIFGGMRWRAESVGKEVGVFDDSFIDQKVSDGLRSALVELFPTLKDEPNFHIEHEWTGIMGYSCDNWPLIGKVSDTHNEWIAAGYCGNGMPQCFGAAKAVAEMIAGKLPTGESWIPHFDPLRFNNPDYSQKWLYTGRKQLKMDE